ncbi:glutamyl-tRNA(Gln) amidotransferase subunit C, chloroplastic/mitochondrial isoform X2 [Punica granatum]|uniref:Glutamyl-tRNA(Gln) amidotransferase subunit C, chloroplastic/mitochondrial n=2 Tax=Punica granatum TaxID=22663 RepID=A0A218W691_PUNGR|nr:glutamyl-tRNA(Gln) amidotransferase subunit C, chloroplastic/mitochondrial isoform X2 [Punica granatum]XP_031377780.1 glutamyl-tRNA(Gln) amidotransferase subunit C, chloroplastic/mitochondrial isoform X2 [Punica granatum]OWM67751.1 hypothetical protein CDL15_Pgr017448 [Punica granatum]PKI68526.1 hypothetical protein CRG98_011075 [Punica granatum]
MGSIGLLLEVAISLNHHIFNCNNSISKVAIFPKCRRILRNCSTAATGSSLQPPDVPRLAETARISLTPIEVEEFTPKIRQVIDWFGQLQDVELQSVEPALRADTEAYNLREDTPETFENREAMVSGVPSYEEPYIKVPKVLSKE